MKKILLIAIMTLMGSGLLAAQEIDFGVRAGVNFAKLQGDNVEDADGRTGIMVGLVGEYMFSDAFGLQAEAIYSQQGLQSETTFGGSTLEQELNLNYINVPVLAKFYLGGSGLAIEAGPQVGFLVGDSYEINGEEVEDDLGAETIDLSAGGGLSYKFKEGSTLEGLSATARYMIGLSNIYEDDDTFGDDLTNSVLSLSIGYKF
ncbi:porin family protein [Nonlabens xiamenensis]|uniref:porin family protein n=1 Tax=Nonlabens xiamenensis TaxID=2341043 RepID=UPI000F61247D|nr:porin family protein [Nonlabens xiamenensis]